MRLQDTFISQGSMLCCCIHIFELAPSKDEEVFLGDSKDCPYCGETFRLTSTGRESIWISDWQWEKE